MADRVAHTGSIKKSLASGRMVISDRYLDSTLAYQGSALADAFDGGLPSAIEWLRRASPPSTLVPDITFFLKISPRVSLKRIEVRQSRTKFERFECLRRVGEAFELLASQRRFVTLDAMRPPESLVDCAVASLRRRKLT
jgi:dTMP kinase